MDIRFLIVMIGVFVGPVVLCLAIALIWWRRTRWFATTVVGCALGVAVLAMPGLSAAPLSPAPVFAGVLTVAVVALSVVGSIVWALVVAIDTWEHRHAA